ncbi:hypothetical protein BDP55DRAFT_667708 [Colletotrichum godetiae]|uniref:Uncharacterized protein n=1 Tax=Colletotrichum godetiae TaxID=1209918 RepID=A0AAJ0AIB2_9PEZI|nr:uncharacterized protein BDP55DRAFT_667708 [Colletotrichum godetiae]KAK1674418.1 hypothetical protein BDP55DRAFT_667708 [Colletotrichum godetiae]
MLHLHHPHLWATEIFPSFFFCAIPLITAAATGPPTTLGDTPRHWKDAGVTRVRGRSATAGWEASGLSCPTKLGNRRSGAAAWPGRSSFSQSGCRDMKGARGNDADVLKFWTIPLP